MLKYENVCFYTKIHNRILRILIKGVILQHGNTKTKISESNNQRDAYQ